jgi:hypothetical protein
VEIFSNMKSKKKNRNLKHLFEFAKSFANSSINRNEATKNLISYSEGIKMVTQNACIRPDIYLDNDRTCDYCMYYEDCACNLKKVSKFYKK